MAAPLLKLDTATLELLRDLLSRYKNWSAVPEDSKQAFQSLYFINVGFIGSRYFDTPEIAFTNLVLHLTDLEDYLSQTDLPPTDQSVVNAALLAELVAQMNTDQASLEQQVHSAQPNSTKEQIALVTRVWKYNQARALRPNPDLSQRLNSIVSGLNPKTDIQTPIFQEALKIAVAAAATVVDVSTLLPAQLDQAAAVLTTAAAVLDLNDETDRALITELAIQAAVPSYSSPLTQFVDQVNAATGYATPDDYVRLSANPDDHILLNPATNTVTDFSRFSLPPEQILDSSKLRLTQIETTDHQFTEYYQDLDQHTHTLTDKLGELTAATAIAQALIPALPDAVVAEIIHAAAAIDPNNALSFPTQTGAQAIGFLKTLPPGPGLSVAGLKLAAHGVSLAELNQFVLTHPKSSVARILTNPQYIAGLFRANRDIANIHSAPIYNPATGQNFGSDVYQHPTGLVSRFQGLTNRFTGILPGSIARPLNVVLHPVSAFKSWAGQKAGQAIARQFLGRVENAFLRQAGSFLLQNGLLGGIKQLAAQALAKSALGVAAKAAITQLATKLGVTLALGTAGGPIGLAVAALVAIGQFLAEKLIKHPEEVVVGAVGAVAAPASLLSMFAAAVAGVVTVGASAAATVAIAGVIALLLYLTAFTAAPLISTLAQLQSGIGTQQGLGGPILPSYTGPILPGCPSTWPIPSGLVIQGPHGTFSHQLIEAIDILTPIGTPVKSLTDGTVTAAGPAPVPSTAYGNWVIIESTTQGGQKYSILYGHLSEVRVASGNNVQAGSVIALSGNTSSVLAFANPHLHLEYRGIAYNSCPAGGVQIPDGCYGTSITDTNSCTINGKPISF